MTPASDTPRGRDAAACKDRILVVDDELGMRLSCQKVLAAEGYEVEMAEDGVAGLELFRRFGDFVAVLVDMKMPRMGGMELIEHIRGLDEDVLLLVMTAYATIDTAVEATKRGAYSYIPKPFTPDELLLPVKNGLARRALAREARQLRLDRERQLLELAFERSRSITILNCMTDGVVVVNRERRIVLRNPAAARMLADGGGSPPAETLADLRSEGLTGLIGGILDSGDGPVILSREVPLGDRTYMVNASPVIDPGGEVLGAVAVLRDITALKDLEAAKSLFVSMVAHEIKNPLAAIEGYLNLILSGAAGKDPAQQRQMMERAALRARTLRTMLSELMNLRAIEAGRFEIRRAAVDLVPLARDAVQAHAERAREKGIDLAFRGAPPAAAVLADGRAIGEVLANLIDNAIKYTPANGHVSVAIEEDGEAVAIRVRDDGIGMSAEDQARVFDEFYRARNEHTAQIPGTGLGLAIVKRLVDLHHGRVDVSSAPGQGSEFVVRLPLASAGETADGGAKEAP